MNKLKYFIFGILFYSICIPAIESISEIITTLLEIPKGKASAPVLRINKQLLDLQADQEEVNTVAMGFQIPSEEDFEDNDDDFEDKKKSKKHIKI
jgi:hypothetical protein